MQRDINAPNVSRRISFQNQTSEVVSQVPHDAFVTAAKAMKRQITPNVIRKFEKWREDNGIGGV
jgi:hypothetical protein